MGRFKAHHDSINMTLLPCCYYVVSSESLDQEHINAITLDPDFLCSLSKLYFYNPSGLRNHSHTFVPIAEGPFCWTGKLIYPDLAFSLSSSL